MNLVKKISSGKIALIFIVLVWFIFSSPFFINNKVPFSSTYLVNFFSPWSDYPGFSSPVKNNAMPDVISQIYPWKNLTIDTFKNFQLPLWNPYSFSGTPNLANYQSAVLTPFNILFFIFKFVDAWSLLILLQPLLAGLFMFLCLTSLDITKKSSVLGSISFMFCGFITTWMAYGTLPYAILFLPLAIYAIEKFYQTKKSRFLILLSFVFPFSFFSGHFQISIYFFLAVILYLFYKLITLKKFNYFYLTLIYSGIGLFLSLPQLLPSIELYSQSLRSGLFEKIEAIPWDYLPTFVSPDFYGNPVTRNDWFGHYAEWNGYIGFLPFMFAFYAIFKNTKKVVWFFVILSLLSILLSFSSPVLDLLIWLKIPVLSTSAASRIIVLFSFSASVLAAFGFDRFFEDLQIRNIKKILLWIFSFGILFLVLWLVVLLKLFIPLDKILIARQNLLLPTIIFLASTFSILFVLFFHSKISKKLNIINILAIFLICIVAFDLVRFSSKWMPFESKTLMYPNVPIVSEFNKISNDGRVLGNLGGEATTYYQLDSVEGYDAIYIKRYGEFIASLANGKLQESPRSVVLFPKSGLYTKKAINLLNIKYIIYKVGDGHAPWVFPFWTYKTSVFSLLYNDGIYQVLQNNDVYPRAFLVSKYVVQNSPQKILDTMFARSFDLRKEVVLESKPNLNLDLNAKSNVNILNYSKDKITIRVKSSGNSLLFLSDTFYPGWSAYVNNVKTPIYRADFTFRAVFIPKGEDTVEFIYNPSSFNFGIIGGLIGILSIFVFEVLRRKKFKFFPKT